jgi:hypothetical protein
MALNVEFTFDEKTYRHYMNGFLSVMHCHHYMSLLTNLAMNYDDMGGIKILTESAEDTIRPLFDDYYQKNNLASAEEKLDVGPGYYSVMGMGLMKADGNEQGGQVVLTRSHVDQGWLKKWDSPGKPVNYWTCGYISAMFAAAFGKPARSYDVTEVKSMVKGDETSVFEIKLK